MPVLTVPLLALALACGTQTPGPREASAVGTAQSGGATQPEAPGTSYPGSAPPSTPDPKKPAPERPASYPAGTSVPFETVAQASVPGGGGGQVRQVIRDEATWREAWAALGARQSDGAADPPAVDFAKDMVILATMETQSCVSKVTIRAIHRSGNALVVDLLEAPPGPNCVCITSERPYHAVRLARTDAAVRFEAELGRTDC